MMKITIILLLAVFVYCSNGRTLSKRETKEELLNKAENVKKIAQDAMDKLKAQGKGIQAAEMGTQILALDGIIAQLESPLGIVVPGLIEKELKIVIDLIENLLKALLGSEQNNTPKITTESHEKLTTNAKIPKDEKTSNPTKIIVTSATDIITPIITVKPIITTKKP